MLYRFKTYLEEYKYIKDFDESMRDELIEKYGDDYIEMCFFCGFEPEEI